MRPVVRVRDGDSLAESKRYAFDQMRREMIEKYLDLCFRVAYDDELTAQEIEAIKKRLDFMAEAMDEGKEG